MFIAPIEHQSCMIYGYLASMRKLLLSSYLRFLLVVIIPVVSLGDTDTAFSSLLLFIQLAFVDQLANHLLVANMVVMRKRRLPPERQPRRVDQNPSRHAEHAKRIILDRPAFRRRRRALGPRDRMLAHWHI